MAAVPVPVMRCFHPRRPNTRCCPTVPEIPTDIRTGKRCRSSPTGISGCWKPPSPVKSGFSATAARTEFCIRCSVCRSACRAVRQTGTGTDSLSSVYSATKNLRWVTPEVSFTEYSVYLYRNYWIPATALEMRATFLEALFAFRTPLLCAI